MEDEDKSREELLEELERLRARLGEGPREVPVPPDGVPRAVAVPEPFQSAFYKAEDYVRRYFRDRVEDPTCGTIDIRGERYVLVRAASLSAEFFELVKNLYRDRSEEEARNVANGFLFDMAHAIGKADAKHFHTKMGVTDPIERLSAGPIHFAYSGWAFVKVLEKSNPTPDEDYMLLYEHPFSFEAESWVSRSKATDHPVCIMNAGYSSGWCEESFGLPLVAVELSCRACGDDSCSFVMAPPARIGEYVSRLRQERGDTTVGSVLPAIPEFFQRKRLEEELRRAREDLEERVTERTEELSRSLVRLEEEVLVRQRAEEESRVLQAQVLHTQKLESLGVLAGGIAHDFNNLLAGIMGNASLVLMDLDEDNPIRALVKRIETTAARASELTRQMLSYAGKGRAYVQPVDISDVLRETAELLEVSVSKKARILYELQEAIPKVSADVVQLRQIVMNLITNASEAIGDEGGTIRLCTFVAEVEEEELARTYLNDDLPSGSYVGVEVTDTGSGMDDPTRARIFDPFFSTKFTGRGLGLAAVLGIVRGHRGAIKVASRPGEGTSVTVLFPRWEEHSSVEVDTVPAADRFSLDKVAAGACLLVVDDEEVVRTLATEVLERYGFHVLVARDGVEALEVLARETGRICAMVLDSSMPRCDGKTVLAKVRVSHPALPIVLMSGYGEEGAFSCGGDREIRRFLQKPFEPVQLIRAVADLLGKADER